MSRTWQDMLAHLAARNGAIELVPDGDDAPSGEPAVIFRCRLLHQDSAALIIERPQGPEAAPHFRAGSPVGVGLADENHRWLLLTQVMEVSSHQLNSHQDVPTLTLAWPHTVRSGQRREFFRVVTVGLHGRPAVLWPQHIDEAIAGAAGMCSAELINISGGGFGLAAQALDAELFQLNESCICRITLPHLTFPIDIPVCLRRKSPLDGGRVYLGLQFDFETESPDGQRIVDEVCRFSIQVQREQLRLLRQKK